MTETSTVPEFAVVPGAQVSDVLNGQEKQLVELVESAYRLHGRQETVNPPSCFLRFPDRPSSRIIALPASVGGGIGVDGIKWISSFPGNVRTGLPRASAVLILNDQTTGYPLACLESSIISATRTAASAALAADWLTRHRARPRRIGFVGTGLIARYVHRFLVGSGWEFDQTAVFDLAPAHADGFREYLESTDAKGVSIQSGAEALIRTSDLVVFATVAGEPHVHEPAWFDHNPLVLHVSLRDLSPEVILGSANVVDDVEHCLKAGTSVQLAERRRGSRDFLDGTLNDVMTGALVPGTDRPLVFSPFGLGVLDLAVGKHVLDELRRRGELRTVAGFFFELDRYGKR